jgi:hypothetical protein
VVLPLRGGSDHNLLKLQLPAKLGDTLSPALFLVRGVKDQPGAPELGRINVFGLGAGPRAVGSVAIDQVDFTPGTVSLGKKQSARFSFYSRSDFNRVSAEVLRVVNRDGDLQVQLDELLDAFERLVGQAEQVVEVGFVCSQQLLRVVSGHGHAPCGGEKGGRRVTALVGMLCCAAT